MIEITWWSWRQIIRGWGWLPPVALAVVVAVLGPQLMTYIGVPLVPTTARFVALLSAIQVPWFVKALIVLYAGELVWQEREARIAPLVDAAPAPNRVLLTAKFLALMLGIIGVQTLLTVAGVIVQTVLGYGGTDRELFIPLLFGFELVDYLLVAMLALAVHVLVDQKYPAHLAIFGILALAQHGAVFGVEHPLIFYGSGPGWRHSDFNGFRASIAPFVLFRLYWIGWAVMLAVAAGLLWARGPERTILDRLRLMRRHFTLPAAAVVAVGLLLIVTFGGIVFYNTNILNDYETDSRQTERRAEYERRYGHYADQPQPRLVATNLRVELYPDQQRAEVLGTCRFVNESAASIDTIHLTTASEVETTLIRFDRGVEPVLVENDLHARTYRLEEPLQKGEMLLLTFELMYARRGFDHSGSAAAIVRNGSRLELSEWLPAIGYQAHRELTDEDKRRAHGLDAPRASQTAEGTESAGAIEFEAVVGTSAGQIAVAPGSQQRTWSEGSRRYFHYVAERPIQNVYSVVSAEYAAHTESWSTPTDAEHRQDVRIELFYHPEHGENLKRLVRSARATLDHHTTQLGRYPHRQLRLIEIPGAGFELQTDPGNVLYSEGFALMDPESDRREVDYLFAAVAREVARQWWGLQLLPAETEGSSLLSESLPWASVFAVVEENYGAEHARRLLALIRSAYGAPRPQPGPPLLRSSSAFEGYREGAFAMFAVREYLGRDRLEEALRRLFHGHGAGERWATARDLYRELVAVAPPSLRPLLADLFEQNAFYDFGAERATAERREDGWRVTFDVSARRFVMDEEGVEAALPLNGLVEIGIYARTASRDLEPLYLEMHPVRSGRQTIAVVVDQEPLFASIDPDRLLDWGDSEGDDNVVQVQIGSEPEF